MFDTPSIINCYKPATRNIANGGGCMKLYSSAFWLVCKACMTLLLVGLGLTACGGAPEYLNLSIEADLEANNNAPVGVAVLVVYNEDIFKEIRKMTANEWFQESEQRKRDNPDRKDFELYEWELMPGQKVSNRRMHLQGRKAQGIVFADYFNNPYAVSPDDKESPHRFSFTVKENHILIYLGKDELAVKKLD